jgi:hypothetical protein
MMAYCYRGDSPNGHSRITSARKGSAANHEIIFRKHRRLGIRIASADPQLLRLHSARRSLHPSCFVFRSSEPE